MNNLEKIASFSLPSDGESASTVTIYSVAEPLQSRLVAADMTRYDHDWLDTFGFDEQEREYVQDIADTGIDGYVLSLLDLHDDNGYYVQPGQQYFNYHVDNLNNFMQIAVTERVAYNV